MNKIITYLEVKAFNMEPLIGLFRVPRIEEQFLVKSQDPIHNTIQFNELEKKLIYAPEFTSRKKYFSTRSNKSVTTLFFLPHSFFTLTWYLPCRKGSYESLSFKATSDF